MDLSRNTKRFLILLSAFTVALVLLISHIGAIGSLITSVMTIFAPFIVGACIAFILSVPMKLFDNLLKKRIRGKMLCADHARKPISLVLAILLVLLLIILFGVIVLPQLVSTVSSLATSVIRFVPTAQAWITSIMTWLEGYPQLHE